MTDRSITHSHINLERTYTVSPVQVYAAWTTLEALKKWSAPKSDWKVEYEVFEPRPGGREISTFTTPEGQVLHNDGTYGDMVPGERLVSLYTMSSDGTRIFSGVLSIELTPHETGCKLRLTELGCFYDGHDKPEHHKLGYTSMLDDLAAHLDNS